MSNHFSGKALTLLQPWAAAVAHFGKDVENRSWPTSYRGPLAIHSGRGWDSEPVAVRQMLLDLLGSQGYSNLRAASRPGCVMAVCELAGCVRFNTRRPSVRSHWAYGPWCWVLRGVVAIKSVAMKGKQGLWEVEFDYELL